MPLVAGSAYSTARPRKSAHRYPGFPRRIPFDVRITPLVRVLLSSVGRRFAIPGGPSRLGRTTRRGCSWHCSFSADFAARGTPSRDTRCSSRPNAWRPIYDLRWFNRPVDRTSGQAGGDRFRLRGRGLTDLVGDLQVKRGPERLLMPPEPSFHNSLTMPFHHGGNFPVDCPGFPGVEGRIAVLSDARGQVFLKSSGIQRSEPAWPTAC
jgi:hypothetical protein